MILKRQTDSDKERIEQTIQAMKKSKVKKLEPIPGYKKKHSDWCAECEGG